MKLYCTVLPKSSKPGLRGIAYDNGKWTLRIALSSTPEKGKANAELIEFLSDLLWVKKSCVSIVSGGSSRKKVILLSLDSESLSGRSSSCKSSGILSEASFGVLRESSSGGSLGYFQESSLNSPCDSPCDLLSKEEKTVESKLIFLLKQII